MSTTMNDRNFRSLLDAKWDEQKFLCVGLDPDMEKIPEVVKSGSVRDTLLAFNRAIIDATKDIVSAYKPNSAFYEAYGDTGWQVLRETVEYIREEAPDVAVIADAKRADIGNTNSGYVDAIFGNLRADAVTVHPYLGAEALKPFLDQKDIGVIVLCRTSNPGAGEIQDLIVDGRPLYQVIAEKVAGSWNANGNCALVVGATYPEEVRIVRSLAPDLPLLIPGVGAQGGDLEATVRAGVDARGKGIIIAVSRSVIYTSQGRDFAEAARTSAQELHSAILKAAVL